MLIFVNDKALLETARAKQTSTEDVVPFLILLVPEFKVRG